MSARVDLGEFVSAFLGEADDLLRLASASLLAVEAELKEGRLHPRAVRDAFRAVHTLKGLSGMVGIDPVVTVSHRMEALLRRSEAAGGRTSAPALDALLRGLRHIERSVAAVGAGQPAPEPAPALLDALDRLDADASARGDRSADAARPRRLLLEPAILEKLSGFEREQLESAVSAGRRALRLDFAPSPERSQAGLNITSVRERVGRLGEIVKVVPRSVPAGPDAPGGLAFALLVLPSAPDDEIARAAGLDPREIVELASAPEPAREPAPSFELPVEEDPAQGARAGVVRVEVSRLDDAMERLSALVVTRFRMAREVARLAEAGLDVRGLAAILAETTRGLRDMRAAILRVRMVRVAEVLERIPLLVRGLCRSTGKLVRLELDARDAELDKSVAERIFPAVVHLVRNAVDHAIEPPAERRRVGKPEEGTLRIECQARSQAQLELVVEDDGAGIDASEVARRAGGAEPASDAALLDLVCRPGLSTKAGVTTTSGRGMGMDIVRRIAVEELGGELLLRTRRGEGTRFTLRLPLTVAIVDAFSLERAGQRFVVPVTAVEEILELDPERVVVSPAAGRGGVALVARRGEAVPLLDLGAVLALPARAGVPRKALLVRRGGEPVAFAVDRMLGREEVVVRPLEDPLVQVAGVGGSTDLGDGRPTLVLDLVSLVGAAGAAPGVAAS